MSRIRATDVLTAPEVAETLTSLDQLLVTDWQIRRLLADCVSCSNCRRTRGETRLYTVADLALARLGLQLQRGGVSAWVSRAVLSNVGDAIVRGARSKHAHILVIHGMRGEVLAEADAGELIAGVIRVPLATLFDGLIPAVRAVRREYPTIPIWNRFVPVADAVARNAAV